MTQAVEEQAQTVVYPEKSNSIAIIIACDAITTAMAVENTCHIYENDNEGPLVAT